MDVSLILIKKSFLPRSWRNQIEADDSPGLQTATKQAVHTGEVILLLQRLGDLHLSAWFEVIDNLGIYGQLDTSFINCST